MSDWMNTACVRRDFGQEAPRSGVEERLHSQVTREKRLVGLLFIAWTERLPLQSMADSSCESVTRGARAGEKRSDVILLRFLRCTC